MAQIDKKIQVPDPLKTDPRNLSELTEFDRKYQSDLNESLLKYSMKLGDIINKGLKITDNFDAQIVTVTTAAANTEVAVAHTIKRIPNGYIVLSIDKAAIIYDSGTTWTATNIYIKSNVVTTTVKLLIL